MNSFLWNWFRTLHSCPAQDPLISCQLCQVTFWTFAWPPGGAWHQHTPQPDWLAGGCTASQGQTLPVSKSRDRRRDRQTRLKRNEPVRRHRWELNALELDDNRPQCLRCLSSTRPGYPLMFAHDTWGTGTAARIYLEKKRTPPALSLNTWWPNQFQIPFAYRYYPQAAGLLLFSLTLKANLNPLKR